MGRKQGGLTQGRGFIRTPAGSYTTRKNASTPFAFARFCFIFDTFSVVCIYTLAHVGPTKRNYLTNTQTMKKRFLLIPILMLLAACEDSTLSNNCPPSETALDVITLDTASWILTHEGELYLSRESGCEFVMQYFDKDFLTDNYQIGDTIFALIEGKYRIPVYTGFFEDFEEYSQFTDLFVSQPTDTFRHWTDFVLLSPANPTIDDYVALRKCILNHSCDFDDNRIELSEDPDNQLNTCIKFSSVAPLQSMVTAKSSVENTLMFVLQGDEWWFEADYYFDEGFPLTIIDFENKWFSESPGIRLMFLNDSYLTGELKYGTKPLFRQSETSPVAFPSKQWVHLKIYSLADASGKGQFTVWQDGVKIIDLAGQTLPTSNSVLTSLEIGITATAQSAVVYMDNVSFRSFRKNHMR